MFQFGPNKHKTDEPIFFDGFCYSRSKISDDNCTIYVECHDRISKKCPARGILNTEGSRVLLTTNHKHARNFNDHVIYTFKRDLYRAVISSYRDLRLIYDDISIRHAYAAALIPYISIVKTMQTWRKNNRPPVPKTLEEYVERLNSDCWRKFFIPTNSNLIVINVRGTDGSVATVFIDVNLLQNFQNVHLYADATYKICPQEPKNKIYQFFTIMASFDDSVLPVAWSLMSHKTMACYAAVINYFKQSTPNLQVLSVTTDFEIGLRNVFRRYYPTAMIKGCYFHYIQALIKKAEKLGLLKILKNWDDGKDFLKKIVALALLPANEIENAFDWLIATHNAFIPTFQKFLEYYKSYWINCIKPIHFSVFGFINKTNNYLEAYNRCLKLQFGIHPRIWQFTEHLVRQYEKMKTELNSLIMSRPVRQIQRIKYIIRKEVLNRAWELYRNNIFDFKRFLQCASQMIKIFDDDNVISQGDEVDNFINAVVKKHIAINGNLYVTINEDDNENFIFVLDK